MNVSGFPVRVSDVFCQSVTVLNTIASMNKRNTKLEKAKTPTNHSSSTTTAGKF